MPKVKQGRFTESLHNREGKNDLKPETEKYRMVRVHFNRAGDSILPDTHPRPHFMDLQKPVPVQGENLCVFRPGLRHRLGRLLGGFSCSKSHPQQKNRITSLRDLPVGWGLPHRSPDIGRILHKKC